MIILIGLICAFITGVLTVALLAIDETAYRKGKHFLVFGVPILCYGISFIHADKAGPNNISFMLLGFGITVSVVGFGLLLYFLKKANGKPE